MATGFYELLGVAPDAPAPAIRAAWQDQVAQVVRKIRATEARHGDLAPLEARREALTEAWGVLGDPTRRRRYDRFRELARGGLPTDPEELWVAASGSMVDPAAAAAVEVIRALTHLRVQEGESPPPPPPEPEERVEAVRTEPRREAEARPVEPDARRALPAQLESTAPIDGDELDRLLDLYGPTGAYLRAVREARGITVEQLSAVTRISLRFLDALERDAFADLPSAIFVRGYLKTVLRSLDALGADELEEYVEDWMARYHRARD